MKKKKINSESSRRSTDTLGAKKMYVRSTPRETNRSIDRELIPCVQNGGRRRRRPSVVTGTRVSAAEGRRGGEAAWRRRRRRLRRVYIYTVASYLGDLKQRSSLVRLAGGGRRSARWSFVHGLPRRLWSKWFLSDIACFAGGFCAVRTSPKTRENERRRRGTRPGRDRHGDRLNR